MAERAKICVFFLLISLFVCPLNAESAEHSQVLFREDFDTLEDWRPVYFPKIKKHTSYTIEKNDGESYLRAESIASASGLVFRKVFQVYDYPGVRWRWRISNVYRKGNAKEKAGDDYPVRVYIVFTYEPERASFAAKIAYRVLKTLYGEYPPHSSLNYIWSNKSHNETILTNAYAREAKMIILRSGGEQAGIWQEEEINIVADYERAFGVKPPPSASIAIMNDSDNTGESSVSHIDYIEVFR